MYKKDKMLKEVAEKRLAAIKEFTDLGSGFKIAMRDLSTVFPACGSSNSAIELTIPELEEHSGFTEWVDVCKGWE